MEKLNYLNVGCGKKFNPQWQNVDMVSHSPHVRQANLLKGIPYPTNQFDVVYHSQVLEHFPKDAAPDFIAECYRILKPGGILRIVLPDLQNIITEYQKQLAILKENPTPEAQANYDWIMLELFDQTVRNSTGGLMADYLRKPEHANEEYLKHRIGFVGSQIRNKYTETTGQKLKRTFKEMGALKLATLLWSTAKNKFLGSLLGEKYRIGAFRNGGEIHYWMYDEYSLGKLLKDTGFSSVKVQNPHTSDIKDWAKYELDIKDGMVYDPTSLFMEAIK
jgi:predicted SAM-dependent methyltransferase